MNATKLIRACALAPLLALASPGAFAADVPLRPPVAPAMAPCPYPNCNPYPYYAYNWSGFYIGANVGVAFDSSTITDRFFGVSLDNSRSGFVGGCQIVYNWQISPQFVFGVEWMFDGTDISSTTNFTTLQASTSVDWVTTLAARFGWAANNWLFYGKVGGGWVHDTATLANLTTGLSISASNTTGGWLVGAGIEYGITQNWSARVEWDHIGLGDVTQFGFVPGDSVTISRHFDMVTVGLNYRF